MTDTTQADALRAIIQDIEAGAFTPDPGGPVMPGYRRFVAMMESALPQDLGALCGMAHDAYKGSLDAAKALHEALLSKRYDLSGLHKFGETWGVRIIPGHHIARNDNPARAWLLAILKAKLAEVEA